MQSSARWRLAAVCLALATAAHARTPREWKLAPDGFGPLKVGMTFTQVQELAPGLVPTPPGLRASSNCDKLSLPGHPGVALMFVGDELARIDLFRHGLRTTREVGPGDPVERVMHSYAELADEPRAYEENERTLTLHSGDNAIRFETRDGRIESVYAGRWAQVQYIEGCL